MTQDIIERRYLVAEQNSTALLSERAGENGVEGRKIVGHSAVFGVATDIQTYFGTYKEQIQKGAFRRAIRERQDVRALRNHDPDNLLGRVSANTLTLKEDDTGLFIEVDIPDTTIGRDTAESIKRGDMSGMSFAFIMRKEKWINGEDGSPDMRIIQDVDLYDVGPVTYPAYPQTTAMLRDCSEIYERGLKTLGKESTDNRAFNKLVTATGRSCDAVSLTIGTSGLEEEVKKVNIEAATAVTTVASTEKPIEEIVKLDNYTYRIAYSGNTTSMSSGYVQTVDIADRTNPMFDKIVEELKEEKVGQVEQKDERKKELDKIREEAIRKNLLARKNKKR